MSSRGPRGQADEDMAHELRLYIENDGKIYERSIKPTIRQLVNRLASGTYDKARGVKAWRAVTDYYAKQYEREFSMSAHSINVPTRTLAAERMEEHYRMEFDLGHYRDLLTAASRKRLAERQMARAVGRAGRSHSRATTKHRTKRSSRRRAATKPKQRPRVRKTAARTHHKTGARRADRA